MGNKGRGSSSGKGRPHGRSLRGNTLRACASDREIASRRAYAALALRLRTALNFEGIAEVDVASGLAAAEPDIRGRYLDQHDLDVACGTTEGSERLHRSPIKGALGIKGSPGEQDDLDTGKFLAHSVRDRVRGGRMFDQAQQLVAR